MKILLSARLEMWVVEDPLYTPHPGPAWPLACLARRGGQAGKTAHNYRAALAAAVRSIRRDLTRFLRRRMQSLKGGIAGVI